ncbi:MAG: hypothetical protein U0271_15970 [Polyangiaceae bacterium]
MTSKPAFWIWILATPVFTGMVIVALLMVPSLQADLGKWLIGAVVLSALVSVPFSMFAAKWVAGPTESTG